MAVEFHLHDIGELLSWIEAQGEAGKKAVSYTIKDIKSRAPGWVASEAASVYNIKKTEIIPARTEESRNKKAVFVHTSGNTLETVSIVYRGRTLTPIHFSMTPKKPGRRLGEEPYQEGILNLAIEFMGQKKSSNPIPCTCGSGEQ